MQEVGEVLHIANSGRVIVRLSREIKEGQILCDKNNQKIGRVTELIGPVKNPFASAIPLTNNFKRKTSPKWSPNEVLLDLVFRRNVEMKKCVWTAPARTDCM